MIVSDLHFGKTGHFRRAGIAVPPSVYKEDLQRLFHQLQYFNPREIIFVGDLFHSRANLEHQLFGKWRHDLLHMEMHLVLGNHDILAPRDYLDFDLIVHKEAYVKDGFCFMHDLLPGAESLLVDGAPYYITGHIHPGVRVSGGKHSFRFPCFYFTPSFAVLPAFSRFTGMALIEPKMGDDVFAIVENKLILVS